MKNTRLFLSLLFLCSALGLSAAPVDSIPAAKTESSLEQDLVREASVSQTRSLQQPPANNPFRWQPLKAAFSVQSDMLLSTAAETNKRWFGNTYITAGVSNNYLDARIRFEELSIPLPGRLAEEAGRGIPYVSLTGRYGNWVDLTVGDFYEQFGSGIILRTYEERLLGIDNSIRGARVTSRPYDGIAIKALIGQQRYYFDRPLTLFNDDRGYIGGADLELGFDKWFKGLRNSNTYITWGASFVSKYEDDQIETITNPDGSITQRLNLPKYVGSAATRLNVQFKGFSIYGEYAYKHNDPTADNGYIYRPGSVAMLSASYSRSGLSVLLQGKRSENFNSLSKRNISGLALHVNYFPPFSQQQTYTLAALYPYATQPAGEWAMQGEVSYLFKRNTALGGKYGTRVKLNMSHIRGLKRDWIDRDGNPVLNDGKPLTGLDHLDPIFADRIKGGEGYKTSFFGSGELYFQDINFELSKKINSWFSFSFTYINQTYNKEIIQGHVDDYDRVNAAKGMKNPYLYRTNIFIYDGKYKLSNKLQLRTELQYLTTRQGEGDWLFLLAELAIQPGLMITVSDQWNVGLTNQHYYMAGVAYSYKSHRVSLSYGRTREGISCTGGVCRLVPETQGLNFSYNANF